MWGQVRVSQHRSFPVLNADHNTVRRIFMDWTNLLFIWNLQVQQPMVQPVLLSCSSDVICGKEQAEELYIKCI